MEKFSYIIKSHFDGKNSVTLLSRISIAYLYKWSSDKKTSFRVDEKIILSSFQFLEPIKKIC